MDIEVKFKDELKCYVLCDKSIGYGIKNKFSFKKEGYQFSPKYKAGVWDGSISLYNLATREFYVGLLPELFKWAKQTGYTIKFNDEEKPLFKPFLKFDESYFTDVLPKIAKYPPKDYQIQYVREALTWNKLMILSPTGCLDAETELNVYVNDVKTSVLLKHLSTILRFNEVQIDTPEGIRKITDVYEKTGEGVYIQFTDKTDLKCHDNHKITDDKGLLRNKWIDAKDIKVGDRICGKIVESVDRVPLQSWFDFTVDNETESYYHNGIIHHNSGKSFTIYCILRYILMHTDFKVLITVPSISLVEQLYSDFEEYAIDDWDIEKEVTKVYGGKEEDPNARVVISTWQSCKGKDQKYMSQFDAYLCDEAHGADAKIISSLIDMLHQAKIRIGLTGTLNGTLLHELEMVGRFGRIYRVVSTSDLMESGDLAKLKVNFLKLKYPIEECKLISKKTTEYQLEIDYILEHKKRNDLLIKLAMNQQKNTLMLFNYVDRHGKLLLSDLQAQADKNLKKIYFIYQKVKGEERELIRKTLDGAPPVWYDIEFDNDAMIRFQSGANIQLKNGKTKPVNNLTIVDSVDMEWLEEHFKHGTNFHRGVGVSKIKAIKKQIGCNILLASYGTLAVGVNIKNLHCLIFCHPLKAKIRTLQSIGRILRTAEGKDSVKLIDIVDDFSYTRGTKEQGNITLRHFFERLKIYESENFEYTITEYKL